LAASSYTSIQLIVYSRTSSQGYLAQVSAIRVNAVDYAAKCAMPGQGFALADGVAEGTPGTWLLAAGPLHCLRALPMAPQNDYWHFLLPICTIYAHFKGHFSAKSASSDRSPCLKAR
jgi:hypothetical protein